MTDAIGFYVGISLGAVAFCAFVTGKCPHPSIQSSPRNPPLTPLQYYAAYAYHNRRRRLRSEHALSVITRGQIDNLTNHVPPGPLPSVIRAPPARPTVLPLMPPLGDPWLPLAAGPRGPAARGAGSAGRPDRPPMQGYYAPAAAAAPSRGEVEVEAQPPVGGYYAPVYAPVPVPGPVVGPGAGAGAGAKYV
ncbi:hypothetical protein QBC39DRAFT_412212 [Podospora conica]|nr:hypothetical protein QBC39DRAFT_412212 [Schizothecium conicum]